MNATPDTGNGGAGGRVLIVDDDHDFADSLSHLLMLEGYDVQRAYSVAAARDALAAFRAEVALLDIRMGEESGLALLAELRRRYPEVICIMMTAYASAETAIRALQDGAYDYVCKPFYSEDLTATLERCFERIRLTRERERAEAQLKERNRELETLNARLRALVGGLQEVSACLTRKELYGAVLRQVAENAGAASGAVYLKEEDRLVCAGTFGPWREDAMDGAAGGNGFLEAALTRGKSAVTGEASGNGAGEPPRRALMVFPMLGEDGRPFGAVVVKAGEGEVFTAQDHEVGRIVMSFANEAARLVRALEGLASSEGRLRDIIDNSPSMISLKDRQGRFLVVNKRFEERYRTPAAAIVGRTVHDILPDDVARAYAAQREQVLSRGVVVERELAISGADGSGRTVLITKFPVFGADREPIGVGTIETDVTARRLAEEQLRQTQKMKALGELTGGIAHDFNNLLAVILGNLELVSEDMNGSGELRDLVEDAFSSAQSGKELTHRLLAFGRQQTLHPQVIDAGRLVGEMLRMLERTLGESVTVRYEPDPELWPVEADTSQLETSLLNLAINARHAMTDGGTLVIRTANLVLKDGEVFSGEAARPGDYVMISIEDTGCGMTPEVAARAIQPFFTTKRAGEGSGLGLSMVYGFVTQSGGHFEIASEPGGGTAVKLYLPRADKVPAAREPVPEQALETDGNGERILVVEDRHDVRRTARRMLSGLGYSVIEASDGREALSALSRGGIDLLFTDIVLPGGIDGLRLAREARARQPGLKVLYTSGYARGALGHHDADLDRVELIRKPFSKTELARLVRKALRAEV